MNETHRHASPQHRQACAIKHVILMMDAWHRFGEERKRGASKVSDEANWITHNELHQNFSSANFHLAPLVNLSEKNHAIVVCSARKPNIQGSPPKAGQSGP